MNDRFHCHEDTVIERVIHGPESALVREQVMELPGEVPLWCVRSQHPDGATRPAMVLIHGFAQNRFSWQTSVRSVSAWFAMQGWDVWNLELRGHGRSRRRGHTAAKSFADYPADLLNLADAMDEPAFWVGHSLGATVAYAAAAERCEAPPVRGIIGIGGLYRFGRCGMLIPLACRIAHRLPRRRILDGIQLHTILTAQILTRIFPLMDVAGYGLPISGWWPGSVEPELAKERMLRGFDFVPLKLWHEMADWGATDRLPWDAGWRKADVPSLILVGDKDSMLFPEEGRAAYDRSGATDRSFKLFDIDQGDTHWGHLDMVLGKSAPKYVWPTIHSWMADR